MIQHLEGTEATYYLWRNQGCVHPMTCCVLGFGRSPRAGLVSVTGDCAPGDSLVATAANQVWAIDYQFDTTSDSRQLKLCNVTD